MERISIFFENEIDLMIELKKKGYKVKKKNNTLIIDERIKIHLAEKNIEGEALEILEILYALVDVVDVNVRDVLSLVPKIAARGRGKMLEIKIENEDCYELRKELADLKKKIKETKINKEDVLYLYLIRNNGEIDVEKAAKDLGMKEIDILEGLKMLEEKGIIKRII